jgi:hypothetical protein
VLNDNEILRLKNDHIGHDLFLIFENGDMRMTPTFIIARQILLTACGHLTAATPPPPPRSKHYKFDHVFGPKASQQNVFQQCVEPLVERVVEGGNACMFAFGQTGAGKTYTMIGPDGGRSEQSGALPQAASSLFRRIARLEEGPTAPAFEIRLTFVEVYLNAAFDLLERGDGEKESSSKQAVTSERRSLKVREKSECGTVYAEGAQEIRVTSVRQLLKLVKRGARRRTTKATGMHDSSSRSHAILTLVLERRWMPEKKKKAPSSSSSSPGSSNPDQQQFNSRVSRLVLVDLAGSETMDRSHDGAFDAAGCATNLGLVVLGRVIRAKTEQSHVPYRDSALTRLLQPWYVPSSLLLTCFLCSFLRSLLSPLFPFVPSFLRRFFLCSFLDIAPSFHPR